MNIHLCVPEREGPVTIYDDNLNVDVQNICSSKQRERIISSPNGLINNVLVL